MLNGIDPILLIQIFKNTPNSKEKFAGIPLLNEPAGKTTLAVVPIYLSELATGLYVDTETKNIDIDTETTTLTVSEGVAVGQNAIGNITTITLKANNDSVGLTILLAMIDLIFDKVTSQEYEITYLHKGITVFGGLLHGFTVDQNSNTDLVTIKLELSRGRKKTKSTVVQRDPDAERLATGPAATPPPEAISAPKPVDPKPIPQNSAVTPILRP